MCPETTKREELPRKHKKMAKITVKVHPQTLKCRPYVLIQLRVSQARECGGSFSTSIPYVSFYKKIACPLRCVGRHRILNNKQKGDSGKPTEIISCILSGNDNKNNNSSTRLRSRKGAPTMDHILDRRYPWLRCTVPLQASILGDASL